MPRPRSAAIRISIIVLALLTVTASLLFITLGPWPAPAQQPPAQTAPTQPAPTQEPPAEATMPAGYVGAETCKGCHEEAFHKFETTRMGRLFLKQPRNTTERLACEGCHGP